MKTTKSQFVSCVQRSGKRVWRFVGAGPLSGGTRTVESFDAEDYEVGTVLTVETTVSVAPVERPRSTAPKHGDAWGSRETDANDPNYGRECMCGAPIRAGERYAHSCPRRPRGPQADHGGREEAMTAPLDLDAIERGAHDVRYSQAGHYADTRALVAEVRRLRALLDAERKARGLAEDEWCKERDHWKARAETAEAERDRLAAALVALVCPKCGTCYK